MPRENEKKKEYTPKFIPYYALLLSNRTSRYRQENES